MQNENRAQLFVVCSRFSFEVYITRACNMVTVYNGVRWHGVVQKHLSEYNNPYRIWYLKRVLYLSYFIFRQRISKNVFSSTV